MTSRLPLSLEFSDESSPSTTRSGTDPVTRITSTCSRPATWRQLHREHTRPLEKYLFTGEQGSSRHHSLAKPLVHTRSTRSPSLALPLPAGWWWARRTAASHRRKGTPEKRWPRQSGCGSPALRRKDHLSCQSASLSVLEIMKEMSQNHQRGNRRSNNLIVLKDHGMKITSLAIFLLHRQKETRIILQTWNEISAMRHFTTLSLQRDIIICDLHISPMSRQSRLHHDQSQ